MDLPTAELQLIRSSTLLQFDCPNCDTELVHKVSLLLLTGLATACIDNTAGDPFRSYASVAVTLRKDMVDYLTEKSQNFITESIVGTVEAAPNQQVEASDDPAEIISDFMDEFADIKRNLFGRVSGWLLSENREDKIDDFAQDMETDNFWPIDRREAISAIFIKNVDLKRKYHCGEKYESAEKLQQHMSECTYRKVICQHEGCRAKFSAFSKDEHEEVCAFKVVECEQKCGESILRRDMDRHCITVCKMRMVNCPFYQIGCESAFVQSELRKHCRDFLNTHVLYVLKVVHKRETLSNDELEACRNKLKESGFWDDLSESKDVRSLSWAVKDLERKLKGPENEQENAHAPTKAPYWPVAVEDRLPAKFPIPVLPSVSSRTDEPQELTKLGYTLEAAIEAAAKEVIALMDDLNERGSKAGDGDCGTTMYSGAIAVLEDMKKQYPMNDAAETVNEIGATIRRVMGGTSGILYGILCKAAYANLKGCSEPTARERASALEAPLAAVSKYGGARSGYRTMLDALIPPCTTLKGRLDAGDDAVTAFLLSSEAAIAGAESTKNMQAQSGRTSYIAPEHLVAVPDPGAMAAAAWYRAAALAVASKLKP